MRPVPLDQLAPIKPPVEVEDTTLWFWLAASVVLIALLFWGFVGLKRLYLDRKYRYLLTDDRQKLAAKEALRKIDYADTKGAVYTFSEYLPLFLKEGQKERFARLNAELARYKYRKEVPPLAKEEVKAMKKLIEEALRGG